jgi:integrase
VRMLIDTGRRISEIAGLMTDDIDFEAGVAHVLGKGRRGRALPFGEATALALGRYLRVRAKSSRASLPNLWIGNNASRGRPLGAELRRVGRPAAGIKPILRAKLRAAAEPMKTAVQQHALAIPVHGEVTSREPDQPPTEHQTGALS